jgi:hypothetical protein
MKCLVLIGIAMAGVAIGLGVARHVVWTRVPRLIERMPENVMPQMMGTCFAQMSREQREYMLGHCRGLLDRMDEQCTVTGPTAPVSRPVGVA